MRRDVEPCDEQAIAVEIQSGRRETGHAARHHRGAADEHDRGGYFDDDQRGLRPGPARYLRRPRSGESIPDRVPPAGNRRQHPGDCPARDRQENRHGDDGGIEIEGDEPGKLDAAEHDERARARVGKRQREPTGDHREHAAFGEQLPHETSARRSERQPDGKLPLTGGAADEQQHRHVAADDEEDERRAGEQQRERPAHFRKVTRVRARSRAGRSRGSCRDAAPRGGGRSRLPPHPPLRRSHPA